MKLILAQLLGKAEDLGLPNKTGDNSDLSNIVDIVYGIAAVIAVIVIIIAGILYATSNGDAGQVVRSKNAIIYAVIGLIVVTFAFTITGFVLGRF
ncbi:MAG: TrbC/VirB2 family protein [Candidatus Saccharibacteria bacterium]|nr:TrbC/VirB2 family protein [Candidatus Saccharibacteria bacterium]